MDTLIIIAKIAGGVFGFLMLCTITQTFHENGMFYRGQPVVPPDERIGL